VDNQLVVSGAQPAEHSDTWIGLKVKSALLFHRNVSATGTTVYVKNGIVTLQGEASSMAQKELTTEYAKDIDNVKEVQNNMTIAKTPATGDATVGDKIDDASITAEVKSSLLSHHSTSAMHTTVSTTDGVVILTGEAGNLAQKELTTEYAKDIDNVKAVVNDMTIAKTPITPVATTGDKIDDASITAEVKSSLLSHHSTSALHTTVSTTDGIVTLSGIAKNAAEKSLVTKLVTDINGVNSVINNMTIAVPVAAN
jgi:hyperosmotically inducible periplasmic protein